MTLNPEHQRSPGLDSSKIALLKYTIDHKGPLHNYNQKTIFWDREHVYNQNLMLKTKLKQMEEINTKTRTRLLRTEREAAEMINISKGKNETIYRSMSMQHFKDDKKVAIMKWRIDTLKDQEQIKRILLMKQKIRQLKEQIDKLKTQNVELKKTMKYTRMSELQAENKQLLEQIIRMKKAVSEQFKFREQIISVFAKEKQDFRITMRKEIETRSLLAKELQEAKQNLFTAKNKNQWMKEVQRLESQNSKLKEELKTGTFSVGPVIQGRNQSVTKLEYSSSVLSDFGTINLLQNNSSPLPKQKRQGQLTSLELLPLKNNTEEFITPIKPSANIIVSEDFEPINEVDIVREVTPDDQKSRERKFSSKKEEKTQESEIKIEYLKSTQEEEDKTEKDHPKLTKEKNQFKELTEDIPVKQANSKGVKEKESSKKKETVHQPMEQIYQNQYQEQQYEDLMQEDIEA